MKIAFITFHDLTIHSAESSDTMRRYKILDKQHKNCHEMLGRHKLWTPLRYPSPIAQATRSQVTLEVVVSESYPTPAGAQQLEAHLMDDDVLKEVPPLHLRAAPAPTALHHLLAPSRGIRRFVGLGKMRSDVASPVPNRV